MYACNSHDLAFIRQSVLFYIDTAIHHLCLPFSTLWNKFFFFIYSMLLLYSFTYILLNASFSNVPIFFSMNILFIFLSLYMPHYFLRDKRQLNYLDLYQIKKYFWLLDQHSLFSNKNISSILRNPSMKFALLSGNIFFLLHTVEI